MDTLNPAAEFDYSPRVRELFDDLAHSESLSNLGSVVAAAREALSAAAGSREQGASVRLHIELRDSYIRIARYQAYGCPHFLAACESLARWLEGRPCSELSQWCWRQVEAELQVPPAKRARLLLLNDAISEIRCKLA